MYLSNGQNTLVHNHFLRGNLRVLLVPHALHFPIQVQGQFDFKVLVFVNTLDQGLEYINIVNLPIHILRILIDFDV